MTKKESTFETCGGSSLLGASIAAGMEMQGKNKEMLIKMGINKFDTETLIELTILILYAIMEGVRRSNISNSKKDSIIKEIFDAYYLWVDMSEDNEHQKNIFKELLPTRIMLYDSIWELMKNTTQYGNSKDFMDAGLEVGEIIFKNWKNILSNELDIEDIYITTLLFSYFKNIMLAFVPSATENVQNWFKNKKE